MASPPAKQRRMSSRTREPNRRRDGLTDEELTELLDESDLDISEDDDTDSDPDYDPARAEAGTSRATMNFLDKRPRACPNYLFDDYVDHEEVILDEPQSPDQPEEPDDSHLEESDDDQPEGSDDSQPGDHDDSRPEEPNNSSNIVEAQPTEVHVQMRGGRGQDRGRRGQARGRRGQARGRRRQVRGRGGCDRAIQWGGNALNLTIIFPEYQAQNKNHEQRQHWTPIQYFSQYYNNDYFDLLATCTNNYFHVTTGRLLRTTAEEMKKFTGLTLVMSCLGYPRIRLYWDTQLNVSVIKKTMSRDRFFLLRNAAHVVNNNEVSDEAKRRDRLWKVRPTLDCFSNAVRQLPREQDVAVDEQMIPFTGHVSMRQHVPRKPNPTGLKNYILAGKSGIILDFEVYQGPTTRLPDEVDGQLKLGSGGRAVLRLSETCLPGTNMYFDRFFTGQVILERLTAKQISGTGTVMMNRFPNVGLKSDAALMEDGRGSWDFKVKNDGTIALLKWADNKSVVMASTIHTVDPINNCKRYSRPDRQYIDVRQPHVIRKYNENMGGVDLINRLISHYRSYHRTKKWSVRVMEHFIDCAVVNSWIQYKEDCIALRVPRNNRLDLLAFKLRLAEYLINPVEPESSGSDDNGDEEQPRPQMGGRPGHVPLPPVPARLKGAHVPQAMHHPKSAPRCRNPGCTGRSRIRCVTCDVYLCVQSRDCFLTFHEK